MKEKPSLKRELGLLHATMLGIGGAISAGVFVMLGYAVTLAGTTVVIALVLCGIINLFTMCSYAEMGAALPKAGGEYTFAKVAYGGFVSFFTGWFEWISNMFFAALSAVGFAYMIPYIIPISMPLATVAILAIAVIVIFTAINVFGVKEAGTAEAIMIIVLLVILLTYIFGGVANSKIEAFQLYAPGGILGVVRATSYIFVVYLGAEAVAVAQAEIKNPSKTIPRAILLSAAVLIVLYVLIAYVTLRMVPLGRLSGESAPIIFAAEQVLGKLGVILLVIGGTIAALSSLNTSIMAQSRVAYALSRDGYFPKALQRIHHKFSTPHVAVVVGSIFTAVLAATGVINFVGYATDFGFIIGFALVNLSLMKLRKEKPLLERPFKVPMYPLTPIAGIVTSLFLIIFIDPGVLSLGIVLCVLAVFAYYIRMVGYMRFRVAFGGISLGLGGFTATLTYLIATGSVPLKDVSQTTTITAILFILLLISVIQIIAGIVNVTTKSSTCNISSSPPQKGNRRLNKLESIKDLWQEAIGACEKMPEKKKQTKADYVILDPPEDSLLKDTTVKEKFHVFEMSKQIGRYFSSLLLVTGAVSMLLSAEYFIGPRLLLSSELKTFFILSLGFIGVVNLVSGLLLLAKE